MSPRFTICFGVACLSLATLVALREETELHKKMSMLDAFTEAGYHTQRAVGVKVR